MPEGTLKILVDGSEASKTLRELSQDFRTLRGSVDDLKAGKSSGDNEEIKRLKAQVDELVRIAVSGNGELKAFVESMRQGAAPVETLSEKISRLTAAVDSGVLSSAQEAKSRKQLNAAILEQATNAELAAGAEAKAVDTVHASKDREAEARRALLSTQAQERESYFSTGNALRLAAQESGGYVTSLQAQNLSQKLSTASGLEQGQAFLYVKEIADQQNIAIVANAQANEGLAATLAQVKTQLVAEAEAAGGVLSTEKALEAATRIGTAAQIEQAEALKIVQQLAGQGNVAIEQNAFAQRDLMKVMQAGRQEARLFNFAVLEMVRGFEGVTNSIAAFSDGTDKSKAVITGYGQALQQAVGAGLGLKFGLDFLGHGFEALAGPVGLTVGAITLLGSIIEKDNEQFKKISQEGLKQFEDSIKFLSEPERFQVAKNLETELQKVNDILAANEAVKGEGIGAGLALGMNKALESTRAMSSETVELTEKQRKSLELLKSSLQDQIEKQEAINILRSQAQTVLETTGTRLGQITAEESRLNTELSTGLTLDERRALTEEEIRSRKAQLNILQKEHAEITKSIVDKEADLLSLTEKRYALGQATTQEILKQLQGSLAIAESEKSKAETEKSHLEAILLRGTSVERETEITARLASLGVVILDVDGRILTTETAINKVTDSTTSLLEKKVSLNIATTDELRQHYMFELSSQQSEEHRLSIREKLTALDKQQAESFKATVDQRESLEVSGITETFAKRREESRKVFADEMSSLSQFYETDLKATGNVEESKKHVEDRLAEVRRQYGLRNNQIELDQANELSKFRISTIENETQNKLATIELERRTAEEQYKNKSISEDVLNAKVIQFNHEERDTRLKAEDDIARLKIESMKVVDINGKLNATGEIERIRAMRDFELSLIERNLKLGKIEQPEANLRINIEINKAQIEEARVELQKFAPELDVLKGGFGELNSFIGSQLSRSMGQATNAFAAFGQGAVRALVSVIEKLIEAAIEAAILKAILGFFTGGIGALPGIPVPAALGGGGIGPSFGRTQFAAKGMIVDEPIAGWGLKTGKMVVMGEAGVEHVIPEEAYRPMKFKSDLIDSGQLGPIRAFAEGGIIGDRAHLLTSAGAGVGPFIQGSPISDRQLATMTGQPAEPQHIILEVNAHSTIDNDHIGIGWRAWQLIHRKSGGNV